MGEARGFLRGRGTYTIAGVLVIYAALGYFLGYIEVKDAIELVLGGSGLGFLRRAIS